MANGLLDLFGGDQSAAQQPAGGGGFANVSNSLIGLGMGLLTPYNAWKGESPYSNALQGWQTGAVVDQRRQQQQQELALQKQRMALAQQQANREPEQLRILRAAGLDPNSPEGRAVLFPKTQEPDLKPGSVTYREQEYPYLFNPRNGTYQWGPMGPPPSLQQQQRAPAAAPYTGGAAVPFTGGGPMTTGAGGTFPEPATTGAATPAPAASPAAGAPDEKPPGYDDWLPSVQKAYEQERVKKLAVQGMKSPLQEAGAKKQAADALAAIDVADKLAENKGGFLPTTGIVGGALSSVYQPSKDLSTALDTIKAAVGFDKLQEMRQSSPTGAALGPVSDFENRLLQSTIASLEQSQSPAQFKANLARVRATFEWVVNRSSPNQPPPFSMVGRPGQTPTTGDRPETPPSGGRTFVRDPSGKIVPQ